MVFPQILKVKQAAWDRVQQQTNSRQLILLHVGIPGIISLVLTGLSYYLSLQIADTGGLGGMGLRSMLGAMQNMLQVLSMVFSIFWGIGLTAIALRWSQHQTAYKNDLLIGFRFFGPVLRTTLLKGVIYFSTAFLGFQLASMIFSMTPLAESTMEIINQMTNDATYIPSDEALMQAMTSFLPFLVIVMAVLMIPVFYRLRMTDYVLMDHPKNGAFFAVRASIFLTRRNCFKLFKLDLSFWWFYLLEVLVAAIYYGDLLLQMANINTGLSSEILMFIACVIGLGLQVALYTWRQCQVSTTYAMVYESLKPAIPTPPQPQQTQM